jgi:hypothetical protein
MLKKDNFLFGALIGLLLPAAFFGILSLIALVVESGTSWTVMFQTHRMIILALVINVIPIRMYFVNYRLDRTGRGILLATFLLMVCIFIYIRYL